MSSPNTAITTLENKHQHIFENWNFSTYIPSNNFFNYQSEEFNVVSDKNETHSRNYVKYMLENKIYNKLTIAKILKGNIPLNTSLLVEYIKLVKIDKYERDITLEKTLKIKPVRSQSGVNVFTVVMSPKPHGQNFTCAYDCHFCPNEEGTARSYLRDEPAVARGYESGYDIVSQIRNRFRGYLSMGHISFFDKEIIKGDFVVEGGTFTSYPISYRYECMRDIYYACNTIYNDEVRERLSLSEEMLINETIAGIRVTGLSIETRPDTVNKYLCIELRKYGVTKVQIGVQTIFDSVLKLNNRGCEYRHAQKASYILAMFGFKIQIHLMPDLYGSNMDMDKQMFEHVFSDHELIFDHLKVYPCMVLEHTEIKKLYDAGKYHPYSEGVEGKKKLLEVCVYMTEQLKEIERFDIRIERVVRDFTIDSIKGGCDHLSLGSELSTECGNLGVECICVRCREVSRIPSNCVPKFVHRTRYVTGGVEHFLSFESDDLKTIFGLLRLRINDTKNNKFTENLNNCSIIREVHVYNIVAGVGSKDGITQHQGLGTKLVNEAIRISKEHGFNKIAVISGNGVKQYYMDKLGFINDGLYLSKCI